MSAPDVAALAEVLANARVVFWECIVPEHAKRKVVTVAWRDGIAHCTSEGCDLTSEHTQQFAATLLRHSPQVGALIAAAKAEALRWAADECHREGRYAYEMAARGNPLDAQDRMPVMERLFRESAEREEGR